MIAPHTAGDPMNSTKWLNCRLSDIQDELESSHRVSKPVISRLLRARAYRLRSNRKQIDSNAQHPDRDRQFKYIQQQRKEHAARHQPQLSVDTKKKELIGNFKNVGQVWCQEPVAVNTHDFKQDSLGRAVPYGIYDQQFNLGTICLGCSADTPAFAVDNIALWCATERLERFPNATAILIEADCGGSNSARARAWKWYLQEKVADPFGIAVTVCHYPTGTSKWNPIEHRLFSEISKTWAGCPLQNFEVAANYIRNTKTKTGLAVRVHQNNNEYATGEKITDEQLASLNIVRHEVCPQWNYTIYPRSIQLSGL
ncbi:MAG: ISAzo13 family transposase [Anaerolineales bacterium]